ncbi:MAG TPA: hypothetical protein VIY86_09890 [Pirellulaceae bacterium]
MHRYASCCEDFYCNVTINTEMELNSGRESAIHFFEQLRKRYPVMKNFYARERGEFVLEEDKERGHYRWASCESKRICSGLVNPDSIEEAFEQHRFVTGLAPFALGASPLDCESLNVVFGFDFTYRGNHNHLVAQALGLPPAFEGLLDLPGASTISYEPSVQIAMDESCRTQCRISIETRSNAYQVRTGEFPEEQLSVYVTLRRYGSLDSSEDFVSAIDKLGTLCQDVVDRFVVDQILLPLQQSISIH